MRSGLKLRSKLHAPTLLFPRPSRQLLEGLGWISPLRSRSIATRVAAKHIPPSRVSRHSAKAPADTVSGGVVQGDAHLRAVSRLDVVLHDALQLLQSEAPPKQGQVLESLKTCENLAKYFKNAGNNFAELREKAQDTPAMSLLFLDEGVAQPKPDQQAVSAVAAAIREQAVQRLSETAYAILKDPKIFLTAEILSSYVHVQSLLGRPESFAEVFNLYANKPIPMEGTSPVLFSPANPNKASSAIPPGIAKAALDSAIQAKILPLCLDIVDLSVCTAAYQRSKLVKQALFPLFAFAVAPFAAYTAAGQLSFLQETMSTEMATTVAFAGIMSYVCFTGTIGYVAITTANDQMDRVTWASGTPLRDRWLREDERAMMDKIAGAWGFKDSRRRGDEEGPEWLALKELVGIRGMVLDKVELMEGME